MYELTFFATLSHRSSFFLAFSRSPAITTNTSGNPLHIEAMRFPVSIKFLGGQVYEVKRTSEDGNCLFRAVADQVYGDSEAYDLARQMCIDYMVC